MGGYHQFLASKRLRVPAHGFEIDPAYLNPAAKPFQRDVIPWLVRRGRAGCFAECGMGKTFMQLSWADQIVRHTGKPALLLTPLAVAGQTIREASKFGFEGVSIVRDQSECKTPICITNYERLHLFDPSAFTAVALDEGSILKNFTGATKRQLCEMFRNTTYKSSWTATPAPNDHMELGNQAEFLGIMPSNEMLARWFSNDTMKAGGYRLKGHAAADFWRWVASWAVCLSSPADIGHDATGYDLPPLEIVEHLVGEGQWFGGSTEDVSATKVHRVKRETLQERATKVAELVNGDDDYWIVWVDTDYEADAVVAAMKAVRVMDGIAEVRGSQKESEKLAKLEAFSLGQVRVMVTKPEIGGFGLNWQHCRQTTFFAGFSYERWYQAIRRLWRFGQVRPVTAHLILSEAELPIAATIRRKEADHATMKASMAACMRDAMREELFGHRPLRAFVPTRPVQLPSWVRTKTA